MLTLFTIPKAFEGHSNVIQRNALGSWLHLRPECEIILCGDDSGVAEVAAESGVRHIPDIERNEYGTPLLSSAFEQVRACASYDLLCYVNADIMLLEDLIMAARLVPFSDFLVVGQRWNIDLNSPWDFERTDWEERLRQLVAVQGSLADVRGADYFVFPRAGWVPDLPPFAVGRPGWDNWFIYTARTMRVPVVDATNSVLAIHQDHGYSHVPHRRGGKWQGPEGDRNYAILGGLEHMFRISDATHVMTSKGLSRALGYKYLRRRVSTLPLFFPHTGALVRLLASVVHFWGLLLRLPGTVRRRL